MSKMLNEGRPEPQYPCVQDKLIGTRPVLIKAEASVPHKTETPVLKVFLPLPPSKNSRWISKTYYDRRLKKVVNRTLLSSAVKAHRLLVKSIINKAPPVSLRNTWMHIYLTWHVPDLRSDVINYHQDLADALQEAIGINDKWFLLHDDEVVVNKKFTGVEVTVMQSS
ncbi:MAG: hypothetical protein QY317_16650 [Candidatus Jettenia caeni]|nr:MAG: hypothetical protein QY317_16650 [Candidatus Jettenia caeni]